MLSSLSLYFLVSSECQSFQTRFPFYGLKKVQLSLSDSHYNYPFCFHFLLHVILRFPLGNSISVTLVHFSVCEEMVQHSLLEQFENKIGKKLQSDILDISRDSKDLGIDTHYMRCVLSLVSKLEISFSLIICGGEF